MISRFIILSGILALCVSCKEESKTSKPIDKKYAQASDAVAAAGGAVPDIDPNDVLPPGANLINAKYKINVSTFGAKCEGLAQIKIKADFAKDAKLFDLPYGKINCDGFAKMFGYGEINIAEMMSVLAGSSEYTSLTVVDKVIRLKGLGPFAYQKPYRPFMPSFLAATREELQAIHIANEPVTVIDARTKQIGTGSTSISVSGFDTPFLLNLHPERFTLPDTFQIAVTNDGFKKFDRVTSFLFDKLDMTVSLKPIAVPKLHLETRVKDLMKAAPGPKPAIPGGVLGELIVGGIKVKIDIELIDQQGLKKYMEQLEQQEKNKSGDSEEEEEAEEE